MDACDGDQDVIPLRLAGVESLSALTSGKSCTPARSLASKEEVLSFRHMRGMGNAIDSSLPLTTRRRPSDTSNAELRRQTPIQAARH